MNDEISNGNVAQPLHGQLRALGGVPAPPTLLPMTLFHTDIADLFAPFETPLGPAFVAASAEGISALTLGDDAVAFAAEHQRRTGRRALAVATLPAALSEAVGQLLAGLDAPPPTFDLRACTPFERSVLATTLTIKHGELRPYGWVARQIGNAGAVRAVGTALGHNPIPLLIPCHRVIRGDGRIGNYGFGPAAKWAMLQHEGLEPAAIDQAARQGRVLLGSRTTHIYCYPTCHHARRIAPANQAWFRGSADAVQAGYRPCRVCLPA